MKAIHRFPWAFMGLFLAGPAVHAVDPAFSDATIEVGIGVFVVQQIASAIGRSQYRTEVLQRQQRRLLAPLEEGGGILGQVEFAEGVESGA